MNDPETIKAASDKLAAYAVTCQMHNTLEWMEGLAARLNEYLEAVQADDRVATHGYGLQTLTLEEISPLDKFGYPDL